MKDGGKGSLQASLAFSQHPLPVSAGVYEPFYRDHLFSQGASASLYDFCATMWCDAINWIYKWIVSFTYCQVPTMTKVLLLTRHLCDFFES
jgi:hypothetical protein